MAGAPAASPKATSWGVFSWGPRGVAEGDVVGCFSQGPRGVAAGDVVGNS